MRRIRVARKGAPSLYPARRTLRGRARKHRRHGRKRTMRLVIVAATGGIGRQLVEQAIAAGHQVTAVARNPRDLPPQARAVTIDLARPDQAELASAMAGADAVLSGLGARTASDRGVASRGTQAIVQ